MIEKLHKVLPFDWDFVHTPAIAAVGWSMASFDNWVARLIEVFTLLYIIIKFVRLVRKCRDEKD